MARQDTLDAIGIRHGTDKSSRNHGYLPIYDRELSAIRAQPVTLLEIGVFGGSSLRMWQEYFPQGRILGVDRDSSALAHAGDRTQVLLADQSDPEGLRKVVAPHGPFDVVIDDGSHIWAHQIASLRSLLALVRPGGCYILEDLHTSYGRWAPKYRGEGGETGAAFALRVAERVIASNAMTPPEPDDPFLRDAPNLLESVLFAQRCAIFRRKA
ncbi:class I SAM-dependent methyltransferase [Falsiroseomonas sp. HC035]|uniref:class I SAM-dependent methyltransferase n=1 Tax=Falsiroseomonas sp. HC035 TaxID=3390999 RepID=UPI003D317BC4